jgi:hypothetical protein
VLFLEIKKHNSEQPKRTTLTRWKPCFPGVSPVIRTLTDVGPAIDEKLDELYGSKYSRIFAIAFFVKVNVFAVMVTLRNATDILASKMQPLYLYLAPKIDTVTHLFVPNSVADLQGMPAYLQSSRVYV